MFQICIEQAADAIFWLDQNGRYTYVNQEACRSLGYTRNELVQMHLWDVDPIFPKERYAQEWTQYQQGQLGTQRIETWHRRKDGAVFPVEVTYWQIWFSDTELHTAYVRDITERKRMEAALHLTQFAIDRASIACYWVHSDSRLFYVNDQACRSLGYTQKELLCNYISDIDPEFPSDVWLDFWQRLLQARVLTFESTHQRKDGSRFPVEVTANYVKFDDKEYSCAPSASERRSCKRNLKNSYIRPRKWKALADWPVA